MNFIKAMLFLRDNDLDFVWVARALFWLGITMGIFGISVIINLNK